MGGMNPILAELDGLSPSAKQALMAAHQGATNPMQGTAPPNPALASLRQPAAPAGPPPPNSTMPPIGGSPTMPAIGASHPNVAAPRGTLQGDQSERSRLMSTGSGESQIYGKVTNSGFGQAHPLAGKILGGLGQGLATIGDIGLSTVAPQVAAMTPGTALHHAGLLRSADKAVANDETNARTEAQTRGLDMAPELKQAQLDLNQNKQDEVESNHKAKIDAQLHQHGFKSDEEGNIVPLGYEEMSEEQQGVHDLKASQEELAQATAALRKAQSDPNSPQAKIAQQRLEGAQQARQIALQRLGLSQQVFNARYKGVDESGNALPGAMLTDEGQPVGSSFSQNVRPTGTERNKGDMAISAHEQLTDIKSIVQRHPNLFGPGYGQSSAFRQWIGSQDPDAQRFMSARTIAADHLAGTFGGRSEAALSALDNAIGQFKDNPKAMEAGLDQLLKANKIFESKGKVNSAGSSGSGPSGPKSGDVVDGYKFNGGNPADQKNWTKVP